MFTVKQKNLSPNEITVIINQLKEKVKVPYVSSNEQLKQYLQNISIEEYQYLNSKILVLLFATTFRNIYCESPFTIYFFNSS